MNRGLTFRQIVSLSVLMLLGRLSVISEAQVGRDIWLVFLIVPVLSVLVIWMFCKVSEYDDIVSCFKASLGKFFGFICIIIFCLTAIFIASSSISLFSAFISATPLEHGSLIQTVVFMTITYFLLLSVPMKTVGEAVNIIFPITAAAIIIAVIASISKMDFGAILPILENGIDPVVKGAAASIALQVAPLVFLVFLLNGKKRSKPICTGLFIVCFLLLISHMRNVMVLGYPVVSEYRFPNYMALTQIKIGELFQGLEVLITLVFVVCQPLKSAICLRFVQESLTTLFPKTKKCWRFVLPSICAVILLSGYNSLSLPGAALTCLTGIPLLAIPFIMLISLGLRRLFKKNNHIKKADL